MKEILKKEDMYILKLRHLYESFGYIHYKMNKFEEYDLYAKNKDFLASSNIITFTDTNGKLLALKPDVTLSIIKNYKPSPSAIQKVYYNENIYRTSKSTKTYKEILQMGLECIGDLNVYNISEVLILAAKSLSILSDNYILDISHIGIIRGFLQMLELSSKDEKKLLSLIQEKNCHGIKAMSKELDISKEMTDNIIKLVSAYGHTDNVLNTLKSMCFNDTITSAVDQLACICKLLKNQGFDKIHLDFSITGDMSYYNGILFRGYIDGIPSGILSGGQYGELMDKMNKHTGAIGFAINMALIESFDDDKDDYDVDILLLYDRDAEPEKVATAVTNLINDGFSVQAQISVPEKLRYNKILKLTGGGLTEIESDN